MDSARRYLSTTEFRGLPPEDQAIKLVEKNICSLREACRLTSVSTPAYYRAKKARQECREIGVVGRPRPLGTIGEDLLVSALDEAREKQKPLSISEVRTKVFCTPMHTNTHFRNIMLHKHIFIASF